MGKVVQYGDTYWGKDEDKDSMKGVASQGRKYAAYDTGKIYVYDEARERSPSGGSLRGRRMLT